MGIYGVIRGVESTASTSDVRAPAQRLQRNGTWSDRYGARHQLIRVTRGTTGAKLPKKVRIYRRAEHYALQWWDPQAKGNLCVRVDGDLVDAISRAREIDDRLRHFKSSGIVSRRLKYSELVKAFTEDLQRRTDAGEITPATVTRYGTAMAHFMEFATQSSVMVACPSAVGVNREFALQFSAFLNNQMIVPNGHANGSRRAMRGQAFVLDVVRAMFAWAADLDRGHLLPHGFRNPFLRSVRPKREVAPDQAQAPDITVEMAAEFLAACDDYQLPLFAMLIFFGLRASEPSFLFGEYVERNWLRVPCNPDLAYTTKGRRDKRFPLVGGMGLLITRLVQERRGGLLFLRRDVAEGRERAPLMGTTLPELVVEFHKRCAAKAGFTWAAKLELRDALLRDAGGVSYDQIEAEFSALKRRLDWPQEATLKDFRHLFATAMADAAMPEHYRRYLLGHAPGRDAIFRYSHVDKLHAVYQRAVAAELSAVSDVLDRRVRILEESR